MSKWRRIDPRNRIANIMHVMHMIADMKKKGNMSVPCSTLKYVADHYDFQQSYIKYLKERIKELEK